MDSVSCLIVDDEPIARDLLVHYCGHLSYLKVLAVCGNAIEARELLKVSPIDILFLDINMPVMDGIRFLSTLRNPPQVIFTTAYKEHASTAFDLHACDYLVKPFSLERFIVSIDKAMEKFGKTNGIASPRPQTDVKTEFFFVKSEGKIYKIDYDNLLYAEANGNTTKIITTEATLISNTTFTNLQQLLPASAFIKVHRSFIINKSKISLIEGNRVFLGKKEIPIGSNYRESFLKILNV